MTSHEIFVSSPELYGDRQTTKYRDVDERFVPGRKELRAALLDIMQPYIDEVLTPALRALYPETCDRPELGAGRACTPCYSLVRRYERGKRQSHAAHYDGHAIATAVVSLSDYGVDYKGGLYVSTSHGQREYAALGRGDAVLHRSSLREYLRLCVSASSSTLTRIIENIQCTACRCTTSRAGRRRPRGGRGSFGSATARLVKISATRWVSPAEQYLLG